MPDHWEIIEAALVEYEDARSKFWDGHPDAMRDRDEARAALAFVREMRTPLDMPDSVGWWAYEDDRDKFVSELVICDRSNGKIDYELDGSGETDLDEDSFREMYPGKWCRVFVRWQEGSESSE